MAASDPVNLPEQLNIAERFLVARLTTHAHKTAILCGDQLLTYADVDAMANQFGNLFRASGVEPEQRVLIALPDVPEFAGALFGTLKLGAAVVMVNKDLSQDEVGYFHAYTRAKLVVVAAEQLDVFLAAAASAPRARPRGRARAARREAGSGRSGCELRSAESRARE